MTKIALMNQQRENDLLDLTSYTEQIDKDLTLILQSLQWDRQHLLQGKTLVNCKYDSGHRIPVEIKEQHEEECILKKQGYSDEDVLLPDPLHTAASTLVKLSTSDICNIINIAASSDPYFQRGVECEGWQPQTLERLQATYSSDERRAIHDAVVAAVPACHDLTDLTLPSSAEPSSSTQPKTRLEILTELRNMKRRRTKYRVASKGCNYSHALRDVINSQMELYTGVKSEPIKVKPEPNMPTPMKIKQEYSTGYYDEEYNNIEEHSFTHRQNKRERDMERDSDRDRDRDRDRHRHRHSRDQEQDRHRCRDRARERAGDSDSYSDRKWSRDRERNKQRDRDKERGTEERGIKREPEEEYDRHYRDGEYSKSKKRRHKEKDKHETRDEESKRHHTSDEYRHNKDTRYDADKVRMKDEGYDKHDKNKRNSSHSYSKVKIKKEKRERDHDYDRYYESDDKRRQ